MVGTEFEGYRILERLAGPGYADLYVAADEHGAPHLLYVKEGAPEDFAAHVELLRHLTVALPNLVSIKRGGVSGSTAWLATERCDGPPMVLTGEPDPGHVPLILQEVAEYAKVLKTAHQLEFMHGDLCPEHILACLDNKFKIVAFGFPELFEMTAKEASKRPVYRPPEQFFNEIEIDARADIYALGMVIYQLIARRRPYTGRSRAVLVECALTLLPQPIETLVPLPDAVAALVRKAIAKHPDSRHQTMEEFISELEEATADWYRWRDELEAAAAGAPRGSGVVRRHDRGPSPAPLAVREPSNRPTLPSANMAPPPVPSLNVPPLPAIPPPPLPARPRRSAALVAALALALVLGVAVGLLREPAPRFLAPFAVVPPTVVFDAVPAPAPAQAPSSTPMPAPVPPRPAPVVSAVYVRVVEPPESPPPAPPPAPTKPPRCRTGHYECDPL